MTIHINELIEALALFCEDKKLKASAKEALKGGLVTGVSAFVGGLLLGPVGLAVGGALGGLGSAISAKSFQPVGIILRNMSYNQKRELYDRFRLAFQDFGIDDIGTLAMLLASNSSFQTLALRQITNYLNNQMSMNIHT